MKTLSNFLTPKRVLKLYNYKEKIENMRAVLCIYYKISPIPINKLKNANFYSSLRKTYNQPWSTTTK